MHDGVGGDATVIADQVMTMVVVNVDGESGRFLLQICAYCWQKTQDVQNS